MLPDTLRPALSAAAVAGLLAALVFTLLQSLWISPLILRAETFEQAASAQPAQHDHGAEGHHHHGDDEAWKPENGWQRALFTFAANLVMGFGYALLLAGLLLLRPGPLSARRGLWFGAAGFFVFFIAPGLGLPPELPGTAAANLGERQRWWLLTAGASAAGLALLCARTRWPLRLLGALLLLAPHVIGAPHPAVPASAAPESLQSQFRIATSAGNAVFWLLLGAVCARMLGKSPR